MTEEQLEVGDAAVLSVSSYHPESAETARDSLPPARPSQIRTALGKLVRQGYGLYKLASAPREAFLLSTARHGTALRRLIAGPGRKGALASQPFVCARWSSALRLRRMIEHCAVIDKLGHPFDINSDQYIEIVTFELDEDRCRLMLDRPQWLLCDGLLCVSLWVGTNRFFSVSFCLSDTAAGRTAYIGGIQGHRSADALEQNRQLTKSAHGMRPRDLAFEMFRMIIPRLGVTQLKCVADADRYQMTRRAAMTIGLNDKVQLDYDEIWQSRGGELGNDGFYVVPTQYSRRDIAEIPVKKRSMYKKRYAMLDDLQDRIVGALAQPCVVYSHAPKFLKAPRAAA